MATEEITISELELADTVLADMTIPVDTATDTKAVTLRQLKAWLGSSLPTGFIIPAVGKINDERFTLLDGKTLSRTGTYEAFCNKVVEQVQSGNWFACSEEEYNADVSTYGQCGKFVVGADYVRIPKITRFVGATITLSEIGKTYAESLPNITGELVEFVHGKESHTSSGAFKTTFTANGNIGSGSGISYDNTDFDASLSSSTYQDGAKVQPDHTKFPYYMVVSTEGQTAEVQIDINKIYEDMNLRANSDLSNVINATSNFRNMSTVWGLPDYSAGVSQTYNTQYTAPSNGFIYIGFYTGDKSSRYITLTINSVDVMYAQANDYNCSFSMFPLEKGDVYQIKRTADVARLVIVFYPMKG